MFFTHPSLILLVIPAWLLYRRFTVARWSRTILHAAIIATLTAIVAGPAAEAPDRGSIVLLVNDRSKSMPAMSRQVEVLLRQQAAAEMGESDQLAVVGFAATPVIEQYPGRPPQTNQPELDRDYSNLHAAMFAVLDLIADGQSARVLLLSDGFATDSISDALVSRIRRVGARIDYLQFPIALPQPTVDTELVAVRGPLHLELGQSVTFDLEIAATESCQKPLQIYRDGALMHTSQLQLVAGTTEMSWTDRPVQLGVFHYSFQVDPVGDSSPGNNTWDTWLQVRGDPTVLVVNATGGSSPMVEMLRSAGVPVQVLGAVGSPVALEKLSAFDGCVIENVAMGQDGSIKPNVLARYVEHWGGGLTIAGGNPCYGSGGYRFSSIEPLLPVVLRSLSVAERSPQALVVLADPTAWEDVDLDPDVKLSPLQQALLSLAQELDPADRFGIVIPKQQDPVVLPLMAVTRKRDLRDAIGQLGLPGDPSLFPKALAAAWDMLARAPQAGKHLVLLVGGDQLAKWPDPATDPILSRPVNGASVTVITWGTLDPNRVRWPAARSDWRTLSTSDPSYVAMLLKQDWELATGGSYVARATQAEPVADGPHIQIAAEPLALPTVPGFATALLRDGATAVLVARDTASQPLVARWDRGAGRVCAVLFPVEPPEGPQREWSNLTSLLVEQIRWTARLTDGPPLLPVTTQHDNRTVTVKVAADAIDSHEAAKDQPLELVVSRLDKATSVHIEPFRAESDQWVARFPLDRTGGSLAVVRRGGMIIARCPPIAAPRSPEFLPSRTEAEGGAVLEHLARISGGNEYARGAPLFDLPVHRVRSLVPLFAWIAVLMLLVDVADRRFHWAEMIDIRLQQLRSRRRHQASGDLPVGEPARDPFDQVKERLRRRLNR